MNYFIFRNYTVEPLFSAFNAKFSGYDDISDFDTEAGSFVWLYHPSISPDIIQRINEIDHFYNKITFLVKEIPSSRIFLLFTLVDLFSHKWQNVDFDLNLKISEFNNKLITLSQTHPNVIVIDFEEFVKSVNAEKLISWKYFYTSFTYLNPALSEQFQSWFVKKSEAILLKRKKCIILDLDNTIWGGVLGEDGIDGLQIGNSYPGNCFTDFQRYLVEASKFGILLAICSKNNESDAIEAFEKNPNMILKMNHIVAYKINWNNKHTNIKQLADELNIGLDSMVFIDDNPVERELVKSTISGITVPDFPKEQYNIVPFFKNVLSNYFQIFKLTNEDFSKTLLYKENSQRASFKSEFTSIEDFLVNLGIEIEIRNADKFNISRIAQMSQKTNQFNLTTKRYSEIDINRFIENGDLVLCASVRDKFGDNGITLLAIANLDITNKIAIIDSYLLSCRILGRGIENVFLSFILNHLYSKGIRKVRASYIQTLKNGLVRNFYEQNGFKIVQKNEESIKFELSLDKRLEIKSYYKIFYIES